jgi:hypothetical protein
MKVAVCLFGYPRHYELGFKCHKNFLESIDYDFFIHSWCEESSTQNHIEKLYNNINDLYRPKKLEIEKQKNFSNFFENDSNFNKKNNIDTESIHRYISPIYSMYKVGNLLEEYLCEYDVVIVTRTDVFCNEKLKNFNIYDLNCIYSSYCEGHRWDMSLNDGIIDVKMLLSNPKNILFLTKLYENLKEYNINNEVRLCHHEVFAHHLKKLNCSFDMIFNGVSNVWWILRNNNVLYGNLGNSNMCHYPHIFQ